ncbi:MAG: hypothetical protein NTY96_12205 [Bacteroidetes bacterium]|nr:hypothetical protein [Bacteroidota bacterium]
MRRSLVFLILLFLIISYSCKKKSESPDSKPLLMTVNVAGKYFNTLLGGVIFISDMQGRVLSDTFCLADGKYRFYGKAGTFVPSLLEITAVRAEPSLHSFKISIETYTYIGPSEWTLQGYRADTVGRINPTYKNIPVHNDAFLVSSSGYSNLTLILGNIPIPLYKSPDDIYIGIPTSAGMKYKWFNGVQANAIDTFDLSNPILAEKQTVAFPASVQYYECRVQGFPDGNFNSPVPYMVDEILGNGAIVNSIDAYYPPSKFQGFHTDIMAEENYSSNLSWFYHVDGQIPSAFRKISASLSSFTSAGTSIRLKASGDLDAVSGTWQFQNPYQGNVEWTVFGPDSATVLQLPQVAPSLNNMFPWFSRDSLYFTKVQLIDLVKCQGYNQMINLLYNPLDPSNFDRQEISSLSINTSRK